MGSLGTILRCMAIHPYHRRSRASTSTTNLRSGASGYGGVSECVCVCVSECVCVMSV